MNKKYIVMLFALVGSGVGAVDAQAPVQQAVSTPAVSDKSIEDAREERKKKAEAAAAELIQKLNSTIASAKAAQEKLQGQQVSSTQATAVAVPTQVAVQAQPVVAPQVPALVAVEAPKLDAVVVSPVVTPTIAAQ